MFQIFKITANQASIIHELVHQIYFPTYSAILSHSQIDFMLQNIYSMEALRRTIGCDQDFYIMQDEQRSAIGFMALKQVSATVLRIEKLYLLPSFHGKGCGKQFLSYAESIARRFRLKVLELNVNRNNNAYFFYLKNGFKVVQEVDIPYYTYVLDDYIMQKSI